MRSLLAFGVVVVVVGVGWAQTQPAKPVKQRPSTEFKVKEGPTEGKSSPAVVAPHTQGTTTPKYLQNVERQRVKKNPSSAPKKLPASALQPEKDRSTPKIDFKGNSGGKGKGLSGRAQDPYRGRLKQKGQH